MTDTRSPSAAPSSATARPLTLASGSPRRRELLRGLGLDIVVRPVDIDESPFDGEKADVYVERLARAKARAQGTPGELILAADTVVAVDGDLLGKPRDEDEAKAMLRRLSGRAHEVLTGVALWDPATDETLCEVVSTRVVFNDMSDAEIAWYVSTGEPMDKAGAYAVQGLAAVFVEGLDGNYSNVVGLPLPTVYRLLQRFGHAGLGA